MKANLCKPLILSFFLLFSCTSPYTITTPPPRFKTRKQARLWHHAQTFLGVRYHFGGTSRSGMDCSGLAVRLYRDIYDIHLPHNTAQLYQEGYSITMGVLEPGDLIFFHADRERTPEHIGVYLGNFGFIHASSQRGVTVSKLSDPYYQKRYLGARRIQK